MNVLVLGSGGREHTIVWKLSQSTDINKIYCIPGNGGIANLAECVDIKFSELDKIYEFIKTNKIDIVVVGPEQPLVDGIKDFFEEKKVPVFGPTKLQAQLEGSKVFAKLFMKDYDIPTADFNIAESYQQAKKILCDMFEKYPDGVVVKADGLAAGKGAVVCDSLQQAEKVVYDMMVNKVFGRSGEKVVIEKKLSGVELSVIAFCDGETILPLTHSQDHKQVYDGDRGPNTGGMGAYSPVPFVSKRLEEKIYTQVIQNFLKGVKSSGLGYNGIIYFGLMVENIGKENEQPYVLEFNCRFGDPETQVVLPLLETDLLKIIVATLEKKLNNCLLSFVKKYACCVVLASQGYPGNYDTGKKILGLETVNNMNNVLVFHAGTKKVADDYYTSGGRVLGVVGLADNLSVAIDTAYSAVEKIMFENKYYRKDIGKKGLVSC